MIIGFGKDMRKNKSKIIFSFVSIVVIISLFTNLSYANNNQESIGLSNTQIPMNDSPTIKKMKDLGMDFPEIIYLLEKHQ